MYVCMLCMSAVFSVVLSCVDKGIATSLSAVQGVLSDVHKQDERTTGVVSYINRTNEQDNGGSVVVS
jgi:hypothetical protein